MSYLRNAWHVAAWNDEVDPDTLFHRRLLGERIGDEQALAG